MIAIIKRFVLFILRLFRRAICLGRKRSISGEFDQLTTVNVVNESPSYAKKSNVQERDWNSWDNKPRTVEEYIENYRENLVKPKTPPPIDPVQKMDLFADMAPTIIKQKKLFLKGEQDNEVNFSRLEATAVAEIPITNELEDWEDDVRQVGWDEIDDNNTKQLIREKRKELRTQRQTQQQQGKQKLNVGNIAERVTSR
ncbi:unnamed protein product [Diamesa serratosioi]